MKKPTDKERLVNALNAVLLEYVEVREEHGYLVTNTEAIKEAYAALNHAVMRISTPSKVKP